MAEPNSFEQIAMRVSAFVDAATGQIKRLIRNLEVWLRQQPASGANLTTPSERPDANAGEQPANSIRNGRWE